MKQYAIRNTGRTPVQCEFSCFADGAVINGSVCDLSTTGWRATMDRPVPIGLEKSVLMTLRDGNGCLPIFIDSAIVRWSEGRQTGWEITHIDDSAYARLTEFMAQHERAEITADVREQTPRIPHRHMHPTRSESLHSGPQGL